MWPPKGYTLAGMPIIVAVIAVVTLSAPFGGASAGAVSLDDGMTIEVTVQVDRSFDVVLARPFSSFEELPPTALSDLGNGSWGGFVELPTAENWSLVFEGFESDGTVSRSDTADLLALGVDRVLIKGEDPLPRGSGFSTATLWLIAAIALVLGSLGALAWWTFSGDETSG
ncbi:MAG: hypothetical protein BMS9Abin20_1477 [Acidimicrobiia bacterium]|nr:MAG: hypothetical protein BMS9Abin20_1477 [Acidimicrobiia bacterium]